MKNKQAFTLIELLVVVLIIGILAAVAVPQYQVATDKARAKSMFPVMRHIRELEQMYKMANGSYTANFNELGIDISATIDGKYLFTKDGKIYILGSKSLMSRPWGTPGPVIYWKFDNNYALCYPEGTSRGRKLCKNLVPG